MVAPSKAWVCGRSLAEIVGLNPAGEWMSLLSDACCQVEGLCIFVWCACVYIYIYIYIYIQCVCVYIYIYTHTHTHTHTIQIDNVSKSLMYISYYISGTTAEGTADFLKLVDELFAGFLCERAKNAKCRSSRWKTEEWTEENRNIECVVYIFFTRRHRCNS